MTTSSFSDLARHVSPVPLKQPFGNSFWNMREAGTAGVFEFLAPLGDGEGVAEQFFEVCVSFSLPQLKTEIVYAPHEYLLRYNGGDLSASLVFPPGRPGAVLDIRLPAGVEVQSQILVKCWRPAEGNPYPDYDAVTRTLKVKRGPFIAKVRFILKEGGRFAVDNGWHAARAGFRNRGGHTAVFAFGPDEAAVDRELAELEQRLEAWPEICRQWWDGFFASCPLVEAAGGLDIGCPLDGSVRKVSAEAFTARQLWHYTVALTGVVDAPWLRAGPIQVADRSIFNQTFTNDNAFGIMLLSLTNQARLARAHLVNFLTHMIDDESGQLIWSMNGGGRRTSYPASSGVPAIAFAVEHYVRVTGDASILDEPAGRTSVWGKLKLYEDNVLRLRDSNGDGLIEWNHIWETGEDNKASPFFRKKGLLEWVQFYQELGDKDPGTAAFYRENSCPVTALNEQAFHLWSLGAMVRLARRRGEDSREYERKADRIRETVFARHWDEADGFYYDFDVRAGRLHKARNLDAYYFMYFERDPVRLKRLLARLFDPAEFNLAFLPSLSRAEFEFDPRSYWAGAAWPREQGFVALALARQGLRREAFELMARVHCAERGPVFSENVDPLSDPAQPNGHVASMVMSSINQLVLLAVSGQASWEETETGGTC